MLYKEGRANFRMGVISEENHLFACLYDPGLLARFHILACNIYVIIIDHNKIKNLQGFAEESAIKYN